MLALLKKYFPDVVGYVSISKSFTDKLDKFKIRYQHLKVEFDTKGDSEAKVHSIYEWIVSAESGNKKSVAFLSFVNRTISNIAAKLDVTFDRQLKSILTSFLLSFDTDITLKNNPAYLNYLGELLILDRVLSDPKKFKLSAIEVLLPNEKSADILVTPAGNEKKIAFDIVSIHGFNPAIPKTDNDVVMFFEAKFNQKIESKTTNLSESNSGTCIIIRGEEFQFAIAPILWNELDDLRKWSKILTEIETKYQNVLPLAILYASQDQIRTKHSPLHSLQFRRH